MNSISQNIKAYRKQISLTQQQLADRLGVTHQTVSNWESGRSMPSIDKLNEISEKLNIDINYLLYGKKADNEQLKKQIAINAILYAIVLILWQAVRLYQRYREADGVNKFIQATTDLWYYLPARVFFAFFTPLMHILPAVIF
ncbi:MAG: helix-turn-helix transcriptional regulator [Oscillospiraceae bacterium]|nr:helix-turn-helix transcriptional regulator [Oscillospiraceae bacterium]